MTTIPLGLYLWRRIKQIGISHVFGVPGDFNLTLLDHIYSVDGLDWVGSANELNAAYTADCYARTKQGAGCLVTTHGVGELSALNGIAGSMTEQVKVIHIVGQTSRTMQRKNMMIHHSVGPDPDHHVFNKASQGFRVAAAELRSAKSAPGEIDRVLRECFVRSGPIYIFVPIDMVDVAVPARGLETPINLEPDFDAEIVQQAARAVLNALYSSSNPCLLVDCLTSRHDAVAEARELGSGLGIPIYTTNMGKGIINEMDRNYVGVYNGVSSATGIQAAFEASNLFVVLGNLPCDTNTGGFTREMAKEKTVSINPADVSIFGTQTFPAPIKCVLRYLIQSIDSRRIPQTPIPTFPTPPQDADIDSQAITQSWIWPYLGQNYLQEYDVLLGETGTASFGLINAEFPANLEWIAQTYYGSIGYATPAAFGAEMALVEQAKSGSRPRGRTILVTGDGSLMLTVQEIGNMIKQKLSPVIFIINNGGYTIERLVHGANQSYNDIFDLKYEHMLAFLGMPVDEAKQSFHRAASKDELREILALDCVRSPQSIQVVEILMDRLDVPWQLTMQIAVRGPDAVQEMKDAGFKVHAVPTQKSVWV